MQQIAVVGHTVETWLIAAALARALSKRLISGEIQLSIVADESDIPDDRLLSGHPEDRDYFYWLQIDEARLISEAGGIFSWGYRYTQSNPETRDVKPPGYFCFGDHGYAVNGIGFHHLWKKYQKNGGELGFEEFSLAAESAKQNTFCHPQKRVNALLASLDYGINFPAPPLINFLQKYCITQGCKAIKTKLQNLAYDHSSKGLKPVSPDLGAEVMNADIYIDTTIDQILGKTLKTGQELPYASQEVKTYRYSYLSDKFSSVSDIHYGDDFLFKTSYTGSKAYVVAMHIDDTYNCETLEQKLGQEGLSIEGSTLIKQATGRTSTKPWQSNVISMGPAAHINIELGSATIITILRQVKLFLDLLPTGNDYSLEADEYNRSIFPLSQRLEQIQRLHFSKLQNERHKSQNSLDQALQLFKKFGKLPLTQPQLLHNKDWVKLLVALGYEPENYDPLLDAHDINKLVSPMTNGAELIKRYAKQFPDLEQYLKQFIEQTKNNEFK